MSDWRILSAVIGGVIRHSIADPGQIRRALLNDLWVDLKSFGGATVRPIELSRIRGIDLVQVDGPVRRRSALVLATIAAILDCDTVFELGPDRSQTADLLAHNLPAARIYTLAPGTAGPARTEDDQRVTALQGEPATFDFTPYSGKIDLVYIRTARPQARLRTSTDAAFGMLSEYGTVVWDAYTSDPAVYAFLNRLAPSLDRPTFHLMGTPFAVYSRWDLILPPD